MIPNALIHPWQASLTPPRASQFREATPNWWSLTVLKEVFSGQAMANFLSKAWLLLLGPTQVTRVFYTTLKIRPLLFSIKLRPNTLLIVSRRSPIQANLPDQASNAAWPFPVALSHMSNGMRPPIIGPERPKVWPRDFATLGVPPYVPPPRPPTRDQVAMLAERYGQAMGSQEGFVASIRRNLTQHNPTRPGPTQPNPTQPSPTQPNPSQPDPAQPNPTQPSPTHLNPTQPNPTQPNPTQPNPI